jgi:hypothetical protein
VFWVGWSAESFQAKETQLLDENQKVGNSTELGVAFNDVNALMVVTRSRMSDAAPVCCRVYPVSVS